MRASRIRIGDDTFHYADQGRGPPVVFLHGAPGDLRTWRDVIAALGGGCRAVAYTQRWFGRVAWRADGPPFGTATHVADLFAFIEALDLAPVSLVAWSYSGHVALKAALERPERFARVLIYEPSVPTYVSDPAQQAACGADAAQRFGPVFEALGRGDNRLAVQRLIDASGGEGCFAAQPAERRRVHLDSAQVLPLLFGGGAPPAVITAQDLAGLRTPVSIAWGGETPPVFAIPSAAAAGAIVSAASRRIETAGHLWPEEDPAGFAALVADWMAGGLDAQAAGSSAPKS